MLYPQKSLPRKPVYGIDINYLGGFGDAWAITSYLLQKEKCPKLNVPNPSKYDLIQNQLQTNNHICFTNDPITEIIQISTFQHHYLKTKITHKPMNYPLISIQLDGQFRAEIKNFSAHHTQLLYKTLSKYYKIENLSNMRNLAECINIMAQSQFFIGVASGMAQVACSVGVPCYVVLNGYCNTYLNKKFHENVIYWQKPNVRLFCTIYELFDYLKPAFWRKY